MSWTREPLDRESCVKNAVWWIATGEPLAADVFTTDVIGTSPIMAARGRDDLLAKLGDRRGGFTNPPSRFTIAASATIHA